MSPGVCDVCGGLYLGHRRCSHESCTRMNLVLARRKDLLERQGLVRHARQGVPCARDGPETADTSRPSTARPDAGHIFAGYPSVSADPGPAPQGVQGPEGGSNLRRASGGPLEATPGTEIRLPACVVCWATQRDTIVLPCMHLCLCSQCALTLDMQAFQRGGRSRCPICRQDYTSLRQVFF